ncbi:PEP-CTERM sorting domain-containing protein [Massilia sp. Dwa41.01b]|uniref:choice-of-anchor J family PEP-CTERM protein n=1 Tax=unclassified Massilia TaxID=2609279 RepID=UPI0015FFE4E3|nr:MULTISPECIES: choice-of-anchor J domain-containing protein [unclassified Massilia]QNA88607.1 PEP-CTERM sorting domain-containing protein [Massilia sp. Dwa41.01b]QNA99499.1 PEP-CTERM sorting domain-containing protein [Massilia sp. Se16.2.3]
MKTLKSSLPSCLAAGAIALAMATPGAAHGAVEALNEGFDNVGGLSTWTLVNSSVPGGASWSQGNSDIFGSQSGAANSYAAASFLGTSDPLGVVDNWLITPVLSLTGVTNLTFWTRHEDIPGFSDLLEVRFASGAGGGTSAFTTLLGTIGGTGGYPADWSEWSSSLNIEGEGRFAFRYVGYANTLNYIGLDSVRVVTAVPEPSLYAMLALGLGALGFMRRKST